MTTRKERKKYDAVTNRRHSSSKSQYTGYAQIQNVKSARVYIFGSHNDDCSEQDIDSQDEDIELFSVQSRIDNSRTKTPQLDTIIFERQVSEDDSLRALALQYSCSMSELRRVNHLMSDQDFYALRTIRIPVKRNSIVAEKLGHDQCNSNTAAAASATVVNETRYSEPGAAGSTDVSDMPDNYLSDPEVQDRVIRTISIRDNTRFSGQREAREFLRSMDRDLENIRKTTPLHKASLDDVTSVLTSKSIQPLQKDSGTRVCGVLVQWYVVLLCLILLIFIVVPIVTLYIYRGHILN